MRMFSIRLFIGLTLSLLMCSASFAQELKYRGVGFRGGLTVDPDQVHVGLHLDLGEFVKNLRFQPNLEIGFDDDLFIAAINGEVNYLFQAIGEWVPYLGGGIGINFIDNGHGRFDDNDDVEVGLNLLGGLEKVIGEDGRKFFGEIKLGFGDTPDFKLTFGLTLRSRTEEVK